MSRHPIEPLSPEERDLASRLSRLGQAEPSAALDAAILAAARAAGTNAAPGSTRQRRNRRWWAWSGVSGGLITGVGMAAALVVTVGVVWQLRPQPSLLPSRGERPVEDSVVLDTEMVQRQRPPNPPPLPEAESAPAAAPVVTARPPRPAAAPKPAPQAAPAAPAAGVPNFHDEPLPLPAYQARAVAGAERDRAERSAAEVTESARGERRTMAPSPPPPAGIATDAAAPSPTAAMPARKSVAPAAAAESTTLDRIEITGSRAFANVPVRDDAQLAPIDWLERVRARRDQGDLSGARASLTLFVRTHPRLRVPDDLRVLLRAQP